MWTEATLFTMRSNNWEDKLHLFIEEKRNVPFKWGENDCCLFCCDWVAIALGFDPGEQYRGRYSTALGAMRVLREIRGVEGIATGVLGAPEPARFASRGDIVSLPTPHGDALGVCIGAVAAFAGTDKIMFKPLSVCKLTWRVD